MSDEDDDYSVPSNDGDDDDESINPKTFSGPVKHIYFGENDDDDDNNTNKDSTKQKIIEHATPSTIRVDGSDLISRCKDFLPLLSDTQSQSLKPPDDDDDFNIPEILSDKSSKESGEASSTDDDDNNNKDEINKKKRKKKKKKKKKKPKINDDNFKQDIPVDH